jgi:hypothetical protein
VRPLRRDSARAVAHRRLLLAAIVGLASAPRPAFARAQLSSGLEVGVVAAGDGERAWANTRLDLGLRLEGIYGREGPRDWGAGPFAQARTSGFHGADYGGGLLVLAPVDPTFPLWFGAGGYGRRIDSAWSPGVDAFVGFGSRGFNYHSRYSMTYGVVADLRTTFGSVRSVDAIVCLDLDLEGVLLPALYLLGLVRGG